MIKALIIDDERHSRNLLTKMLTDFCEGVEVVGEAHDVPSGIALLKAQQADVILLDIEMPGGDGFDILNAVDYSHFNVIFITGYDQYAIKAIKYAAMDYLLKPVDLEELQAAITKVKNYQSDTSGKLRFLHTNYKSRNEELRQIVLPGRDSYSVIELDKVIRIEAQGSYVMFHLENNKSHLVVNSLTHYEELLPQENFFRIHKSHLINIHKVERVDLGRRGKVRLNDGSELDIAARRKSTFNQMIKRMKRS